MGPQLPACPAVSYHLITATWPKHRRASPSRPDKYAYLGGGNMALVSFIQYLF